MALIQYKYIVDRHKTRRISYYPIFFVYFAILVLVFVCVRSGTATAPYCMLQINFSRNCEIKCVVF